MSYFDQIKNTEIKENAVIMGIETSCDETAVAIVKGGRDIIAERIKSSATEHAHFGGVVPEIASRSHTKAILTATQEALKEAKVLSGGEKVRCMLAKMMLEGGNFLLLDEPTNHLDLEAITALNTGLINFKGNMLITSHDQELMNTVCNRIIEIDGTKTFDKLVSYDEYLTLTDNRLF